jgi:hypothetical protein
MLLPDDTDLRARPFSSSLKFTSIILQKKFKLYISSKLYDLSKIILVTGTISMVLYVIFYHSLVEILNKERLMIDLLLMIIVPVLYLSTFYFKWSKTVNTYEHLFQIALLICSGLYSITTGSEYSFLGVLVLQFLALTFSTPFLGFVTFSLISLVLFAAR